MREHREADRQFRFDDARTMTAEGIGKVQQKVGEAKDRTREGRKR